MENLNYLVIYCVGALITFVVVSVFCSDFEFESTCMVTLIWPITLMFSIFALFITLLEYIYNILCNLGTFLRKINTNKFQNNS